MVTRFGKENAGRIAREVAEAVTTWADRHDLDVTIDRGVYEDAEFTLRVKLTLRGEDAGRTRFASRGRTLGFNASDYGAEVKLGGYLYRVEGIKTGARKRPVLIRRLDNSKLYLGTVAEVKRALGRPECEACAEPLPQNDENLAGLRKCGACVAADARELQDILRRSAAR